jgi:hypothetical protein
MGRKSPQPPFERGALVGRLVLERGALVGRLVLERGALVARLG